MVTWKHIKKAWDSENLTYVDGRTGFLIRDYENNEYFFEIRNRMTKEYTVRTYYPNSNQIHEVINYKKNKLHGPYMEYLDTGEIFHMMEYKNGEFLGKEKFFYDNGFSTL